jgi:hypothetical protein
LRRFGHAFGSGAGSEAAGGEDEDFGVLRPGFCEKGGRQGAGLAGAGRGGEGDGGVLRQRCAELGEDFGYGEGHAARL